ncbi:unnamed protein product [Paramecium primaurelia]|uniref:Uncharacterized protein n=1 Tax=Paramecium primaurelia TaxID=5886 RepID=A0A8S1MWL8_PARPR|nr:unnamed protein product [Paramecium primaurelia]
MNKGMSYPIKIKYDTLSLLNLQKVRYKNPALTIYCQHYKFCFEMQEALQEIEKKKYYQCPYCSSQAKCQTDLVQDWRVKAYQEFNELVEDVTIIKGIMVNKYTGNKTKNFFMIDECSNQFFKMFERASQDNSINFLIQKDLEKQNLNQQGKINFWNFCLLDRVKINIPVRIFGCKHYECYELTSLLLYWQQHRQKKEYFECNHAGCSSRLRITNNAKIQTSRQSIQTQNQDSKQIEEKERILDLQTLFSGICIDLDLLNAINKSNPSSFKFYYNKQTKKIEEDINRVNDQLNDPFIFKFYQQNKDLQNKVSFQVFQKLIFQQAMPISQGDLLQEDKKLGKSVALNKYRNYKVKMIDQYTQLIIEYPVRCKFCKDLTVCMDMRSYIADFIYQKTMNPFKYYTCPLCKTQQTGQMFKVLIQNYIYLDQNMLSYMFKDMSYTKGTNIFEYKGEQYMLQEFMDRQKITRETYIASLTERQVLFKQLFCGVKQDLRIKQPLIIQNCPQKKIVDFKSFYEKLKEINFDLENEELILCKCSSCYSKPIKSFIGNIYFHEAFHEALNKFYLHKESEQDIEFTYKFTDNEIDSMIIRKTIPTKNHKIKIVQNNDAIRDSSNLRNLYGDEGFLDLMNDEEYQKFFLKTDIEGYAYKAYRMIQNIGQIQIYYQQEGIHANVKELVENFNKNVNQDLKKFLFKLSSIQIHLNDDVLNFGKRTISYQQK